MSKKRAIILISVLGVIAVLMVICSTVFRVNALSVNFVSSPHEKVLASDIIEASTVKKGQSVFFVNEDEIKASVEKNVPYAKVNSVEVRFPNKVIFHIAQREAYCYVSSGDEMYVCDEELKILEVVNSYSTPLVEIKGINVNGKSSGDFLTSPRLKEAFGYFNGSYSIDDSEYFSLADVESSVIRSIEVVNNDLIVKTVKGFTAKIYEGTQFKNEVIVFMGYLLEINASSLNAGREDFTSIQPDWETNGTVEFRTVNGQLSVSLA